MLDYTDMYLFFAILLFSLLLSCQNNYNNRNVVINLNEAEARLEYSSFVDSISYLTLYLDEEQHLGNIERLYKRGDYYYVWGTHKSGIYIFDVKGNLHSHIDAYGEGPYNFLDISSFSVVLSTGDICVLDYASQKLKYYGMDGRFLYSEPCPHWSVDLVVPEPNYKIFIAPFYISDNNPTGIWVSGENNTLLKYLRNDVSPKHKFYYYPMTYNIGDLCFYYYDRNWNYFSSISNNEINILYRFDLKQKIPTSLMDRVENEQMLNGYAICDKFAYSHSNLLMLFCRFNYKQNKDECTYIWAMIDNDNKGLKLAYDLYNDLDSVKINNKELFHIDNMTWARVLDEKTEDFNVNLQLLHLKR